MTISTKVRSQTTVYVVDDDPAVRDSLKELVASIGLVPACFSSAEQFLESYDQSGHGCLVVDIRMPGMSGIELQRRLTAEGVAIPVIIVTGHGDVAMCAAAMKGGAVDFLEKPYRPSQLRESIEQAVRMADVRRRESEHRARLTRKVQLLAAGELTVLRELLKGKQNKGIAADLDISLRTVQLRRSSIMRKLGVGSLPELVALLAPVWKVESPSHE